MMQAQSGGAIWLVFATTLAEALGARNRRRYWRVAACRNAAQSREDLANIINFALEKLVRQRYEFPAFNTMLRAARAARTEINQGYYARVRERLSVLARFSGIA